MHPQFFVLACALVACSLSAQGAPLDALLNLDENNHAGQWRLELAGDVVNDTVDVFKIRANDATYSGTNVGDYAGAHVASSYALTDELTLSGAIWKRRISYREDQGRFQSWQAGGQWRVLGSTTSPYALGIKVGVWHNSANQLTKSSGTLIGSRTVTDVTIRDVSDAQKQVDVIAGWRVSSDVRINAFAGAADSVVQTGDLNATYTSGAGCPYLLSFTQTSFSGQRIGPCTSTGPILDSFQANENVSPELGYRAQMVHLGLNALWTTRNWWVRGGYQFQRWTRAGVDDQIAASGGSPITQNHIFVGEVARAINPQLALFVRGQYMSNQFLGEVPFAYNRFTASKFSRRYGLVTAGLWMFL